MKKLVCAAGIVAMATGCAVEAPEEGEVRSISQAQSTEVPAQMIIKDSDKYRITFAQSEEGIEVLSPAPEKMEYVEDSLSCFTQNAGSPSATPVCIVNVRVKKDGPVNLKPLGDLGPIAYGMAEFRTPTTASISLDLWGYNKFHIGEVVSEVYTDLEAPGLYSTGGRVESSKVDETDDYIEVRTAVWLTPFGATGADTEYKDVHFVASGIMPDELKIWDTELLGEGFAAVEGNKGLASAVAAGEFYAFLTDRWAESSGHYTALRFFTNGDDKYDDGLDLSKYNTLTTTIGCDPGLVVEAFYGTNGYGEDSTQKFLADIHCDGFLNTYTFDISDVDSSDIQTALWLHIPTWKNNNPPVSNQYRIYMNVEEVVLSK